MPVFLEKLEKLTRVRRKPRGKRKYLGVARQGESDAHSNAFIYI